MRGNTYLKRLLGLGVMLGITCLGAHAITHNVPGDFGSIQAAINDAAVGSGDIIEVTAPATEGGFSISNGKNLTIRKVGVGQVLMTNQCNLQGAITARVEGIDVASPNIGIYVDGVSSITLSGCSINGTSGNSAIYVATSAGGNLRVANSTIQYSGAGGVDAIQYYGNGALTLDGSAIIDAGRVGVIMGITANSTLNVINGSVIGNAPQFGIWALANNVTVNVSDSSVSTNTLDGIYMESTGGILNATNTAIHNNRYGIWFPKATAATLTNCTIRNNTSSGVYRNANAGTPMTLNINGGVIRNNGGNGGIDSTELMTLNMTNVQLLNNTNFGVFLRDRCEGPWTMTGCTLQGNTINSVRIQGQPTSNPLRGTAVNCFIRDGSANAQANFWIIGASANMHFVNCVFDEGNSLLNVQPSNANTSATAVVEYCTLVSRPGTSFAGIIAAGDTDNTRRAEVYVRNSIISGPSNGLYLAGASINKFFFNDYNLMDSGTNYANGAVAGANDRTGDPKFVTATTGVGTADLRLQGNLPPSPAIDAANVGLSPGITTDIIGTSRPLPAGTAPDMGAYEEISVPVELSSFDLM